MNAAATAGTSFGDLLVVTPWYPQPGAPYAGTFVRESVRALQPHVERITVVHVDRCLPGEEWTPAWAETPEGRLLRIPAPMEPLAGRDEMMRAHGAALRAHALDLVEAAGMIHCHVGAPTAAGLVELVRPGTRLVVTEHASYLPKVMRNPEARAMYRRALERADAFTVVADGTASALRTWFPDLADRISVLPNPVPVTALSQRRPVPSGSPARWLFIGNLIETKGVGRLVRAFAAWSERCGGPEARLTIVGDGAMRADVESLAEALGVADRVVLTGSLEPDRMPGVYAEHDLLVHLSHFETFGMTCVEAAASGLAVVVTQCGGPEETLLAHQAAGLARFVPVGPDTQTDDVVAAVESLRGGGSVGSLAAVTASRRYLAHHFGSEVVGARLHAALTGVPAPAPEPLPGLRLLAVALDDAQAKVAQGTMHRFATHGGGGLYIAGSRVRAALPPSVTVVDVSWTARGGLLGIAERFLLCRLPGLPVRVLGKVARSGVLPERVSRPIEGWSHRTWRALRAHRGPWARTWRHVAPWVIARRLERRGTLQAAAELDCVIAPHVLTTPIVARALRINRDLTTRSGWPRGAILRSYATHAIQVVDVTESTISAATAATAATAAEGPAASEAWEASAAVVRVGRQGGPRDVDASAVRDESPAQLAR